MEQDGVYYHSELYDRARKETLKNRRKQGITLAAERYSALLSSRMRISASPSEQLEASLHTS